MPTIMGPDPSVATPLGVVPQTVVAQQKMPRSDRLEVLYPYNIYQTTPSPYLVYRM